MKPGSNEDLTVKLSSLDETEVSPAATSAEPSEAEKPKQYSSCFPTLMNLVNTLVGAEILGIPNSMTLSGLYISIGLMVFACSLSYCSTILVVRLQNRTQALSVNDMATKILGVWGGKLLSGLTLCFTYSAQVAYLVIGSETCENWLKLAKLDAWTVGWRRAIMVFVYAMAIPIALTVPKKMGFLNSSSTIAMVFLIVYIIAIVYEACVYLPSNGINPTVELAVWTPKLFNALSIYSLIFALPAICLPLLNPYTPRLQNRFRVVGGAFMICFCSILIPSVAAYMMFGASTAQIVFGSFPQSDILIQIIRVTFFFVSNASFPVVGIAVITDISDLIYKEHEPASLPWSKRIVTLLVADGPPLLIAMWLPKVRPALEVGGALGGCITNFMFPELLWVKQSEKKWYNWTNLIMLLFALVGGVSAIISTYEAILECIEAFKEGFI